jgi:hypothetical protein
MAILPEYAALETGLALDASGFEVGFMIDDYRLRADTYRETARQLRCTAFKRVAFDLCRKEQLLDVMSPG